MAIVNFKLKPAPQEYRPLNCQAVAQLIRDFKKGIEANPSSKEPSLDHMHLLYLISKRDPNVYSETYGSEWAAEIKEANRRILQEHGVIMADLIEQ